MNFWVLTFHSLLDSFTYIDSTKEFEIDIMINTDLNGSSSVFRVESINSEDKIIGYVSGSVNEIRFLFTVNGVNGSRLRLNKLLDSRFGVGIDEIRNIDSNVYSTILSDDPNNVVKIFQVEEEFYQQIQGQLVAPFYPEGGTTNHDQQVVTETRREYDTPTKNPKTDGIPHNRIAYGAPGTGKSYKIEQERKDYFGSNYERVTFHPNYSYGQFFGTYKPKPIKGENTITYELVPGSLLRTLIKAFENKDRNYLLVIEEINRANTAAVFGDVFQLLDRDSNGKSEYNIMISEDVKDYITAHTDVQFSNNELYLPDNFYIWSTMNTADQGVYPIDSAFKRRFDFEYIGLDEGEGEFEGLKVTIPGVGSVLWNDFRKELNTYLMAHVRNIKEDKLIGPFFIKKEIIKSNDDQFTQTFKNKLLMYLSEDVLKTMNKSILFKHTIFSHMVKAFDRDENVFSDDFISVLKPFLAEE